MRLVFSVLFMTLLINQTYGQIQTLKGTGNVVLKEAGYTQIEGSPYFFDEWKNGIIKDNTQKTYDNVLIRYDCYRDEVQMFQAGKTLAIEPAITPEFIFKFYDEETKKLKQIIFRNGYSVQGFTDKNYFNVVYDGKAKLLKKIRVEYLNEVTSNYGTNEQIKKFVRDEVVIVLFNDGRDVQLKGNRKDLLSYFGTSTNEIKKLIKNEKLNLKNDSDLIRVLETFESLN